MERLSLFTVLLTILLTVSVACASARLAYLSEEQQVAESMTLGIAEEALRPGASLPFADMVKFCLVFVLCYYGFRLLEDTYIILSTLSTYLRGKSGKLLRSRWKAWRR